MVQFVSMFDLPGRLLGKRLKWTTLTTQTRAVVTVVFLVVVTGGLGILSVFTSYSYTSLLILGVFYGVMLSYPVTRFFGPKVQSIVTGFLGGLTLGNIGTQEAKLRAWIIGLSNWIKQQVASANPPPRLNDAIVASIWTTMLIALAILAANTYFANQSANPVGNPVPKPPSPALPEGGRQLAQNASTVN